MSCDVPIIIMQFPHTEMRTLILNATIKIKTPFLHNEAQTAYRVLVKEEYFVRNIIPELSSSTLS